MKQKTMEYNATILPKKHANIKGEEQLYLIINTKDKAEGVIINIGEKTFNSLNELLHGKTKTTTGNKLDK